MQGAVRREEHEAGIIGQHQLLGGVVDHHQLLGKTSAALRAHQLLVLNDSLFSCALTFDGCLFEYVTVDGLLHLSHFRLTLLGVTSRNRRSCGKFGWPFKAKADFSKTKF